MRPLSRALMQLNLATHAYHAEIDAPWLELTSDTVTRGYYIQQLARVFGFEGPVEGALAYTPSLSSVIELRTRMRSGLIAQDLLALDLSPTQLTLIPQCESVAPFTTVVEGLGWLYAIERASLLHELVRHHLLQRIPNIDSAIAYLSAYRGIAGERWAELGDAIDLVAISPVVVDKMIESAIAGFECAHAWFKPSYAQASSSH